MTQLINRRQQVQLDQLLNGLQKSDPRLYDVLKMLTREVREVVDTVDPVPVQGAPGATGPAGKGVRWMGEWASGTVYEPGDLVYRDTVGGGASEHVTYFCLQHVPTSQPPPAPGGDANWWEIGKAYLILDGSRPMTGDLNMGTHEVDAILNANFTPNVVQAAISSPSRLDMNIAVQAGVSYTAAEGRVSWDSIEDVFIAYVASGAGVVLLALGWATLMAVNGT